MRLLATAVSTSKHLMVFSAELSRNLFSYNIECTFASSDGMLFNTSCGPLMQSLEKDNDSAYLDCLLIDARDADIERSLNLMRSIIFLNEQLPIFVLLPDATSDTMTLFLDAGAWDCLALPFNVRELSARINGLSRRSGSIQRMKNSRDNNQINFGNLKFSPVSRNFYIDDVTFRITPKELAILMALILARGESVDREILTKNQIIQGASYSGALDSQVSRLRKKLLDANSTVTIQPDYSIGYRLASISKRKAESHQSMVISAESAVFA